MIGFVVILLCVGLILALVGVLVLSTLVVENAESEKARIDAETRRAERRIHDIASQAFQRLLDDSRTQRPGRVRSMATTFGIVHPVLVGRWRWYC